MYTRNIPTPTNNQQKHATEYLSIYRSNDGRWIPQNPVIPWVQHAHLPPESSDSLGLHNRLPTAFWTADNNPMKLLHTNMFMRMFKITVPTFLVSNIYIIRNGNSNRTLKRDKKSIFYLEPTKVESPTKP